ncbi:MAG: hypothetical protein Q4A66_10580, partial [Eubacteriales bacterium]|nr:hypothetical protein [Eubacteriales bacterium]
DDDDDDYDDYDDDDDEDDRRSGFGWGLLRFLRTLLVLLIVGALLVLGLRELEKRNVLSLDAVRSFELGGVTEALFPAPADANDLVIGGDEGEAE